MPPGVMAADDFGYLRERTVLVVTPHADDPALFCGGTLALMARAGARLVFVRITNDDTDSLGLTRRETVQANAGELRDAAKHLGISEIVDFDYPSDRMSDVAETELREQLIRQVRIHRPYAVITFDPYSAFGEDNQDHVRTAQAMDETFWTAMFDKHHEEHFDQGLRPHGVVERWYFGRRVLDVTTVVDISSTLDVKCAAAAAHATMMANMVNQLGLMADTAGIPAPELEHVRSDPSEVVALAVRAGAARTGERYDIDAAEEFRVVRFSGMEPLLDLLASR